MMCLTFKASTAYCNTECTLASKGGTILAILRCTNSSPGPRPTISLAGTRLSAQPIQRYSGVWVWLSRWKYSGSPSLILSAQARLLAKSFGRNFILTITQNLPSYAAMSLAGESSRLHDVDHPGCVLTGMADGRANKPKAARLQSC